MHLALSNVPRARQLRTELELPVTTRHLQQILLNSRYFQSNTVITKPPLTKTNKNARFKFAQGPHDIGCRMEKWFFFQMKKMNARNYVDLLEDILF